MAEIRIFGNKKLKTINREFQEFFPFLGVCFFTAEEWEKARKGEDISPLNCEQKLSSVRKTVPVVGELGISVHGRTQVKNLVDNFLKTYGLYVQVFYEQDGKLFYTADAENDMSLTQLNAELEKGGYAINPGTGQNL